MKTCVECGNPFDYIRSNKHFCSKKCYDTAWNKKTKPYTPRPINQCARCGRDYRQHSGKNLHCSILCWERDYRQKNPRRSPLTHEGMLARAARGYQTRIKNAVANIPDALIIAANQVVDRRLSLPARMVSVRNVASQVMKRTGRERKTIVSEALYQYIYTKLEEAGGKVTDFFTAANTRAQGPDTPGRAVFMFPPLKER